MSGNKFSTPIIDSGAFISTFNSSFADTGACFDIQDRSSSESNGNLKLWRAVIAQAFIDAGSNAKKLQLKREKKRAIIWLIEGGEDFETACTLADMNIEYVRKRARILYGKWYEENVASPQLKDRNTDDADIDEPDVENEAIFTVPVYIISLHRKPFAFKAA